MKSFIFLPLAKHNSDYQTKKNKTSRTCDTYGEGKFLQEIQIEFSCLKLRKKVFFWNVEVDLQDPVLEGLNSI
jgi:hypothetical protein